MKPSRNIGLLTAFGLFAFLAILLFWLVWFSMPQAIQIFAPESPEYACYIVFERAFLFADAWLAIIALCGAVGLIRKREWGLLCITLAGSSAIFLGLMDLLYDLQHNVFIPLTPEAMIELLIVTLLLGLGGVAIVLSWGERQVFAKRPTRRSQKPTRVRR